MDDRITTLGTLVARAAGAGDKDALVFPTERMTFSELDARTDGFARALRALGVNPGDKVGVLMPDSLDYVVALFGTSKVGAVPVPINGRFKSHELHHVIAHADMRVIVTGAAKEGTDYPTLLGEVLPDLGTHDARALDLDEAPELRQIVCYTPAPAGFLSRDDFEAGAESVPAAEIASLGATARIADAAILMYTSGTTSKPKGCLLTHQSLVRNAVTIWIDGFGMTADDVFFDPLPLFHIGGIVPLLACLAAQTTYCHTGHFEPDSALRLLEEERCTIAYPTFETIWLGVLDHPRFPEADLSALRLVHNVGVPERLLRMQERLPQAVQFSVFGMTECSSHLTHPDINDTAEVRARTLGRPLPGLDVKVVDPETGEPRPTGVVGELCFRGYTLFDGYYKDPEQTAAAFDADGFFHTGDLATQDADGRLAYAGRLKDMLKVGGENVSALEVEDYLARHPSVGIVQVVGAPDARYEEVPAAFIQLKPGASATESEIIDFCKGQIASFKVPRHVRFVTEWPMSGTKIQKYVLRERIREELAANK